MHLFRASRSLFLTTTAFPLLRSSALIAGSGASVFRHDSIPFRRSHHHHPRGALTMTTTATSTTTASSSSNVLPYSSISLDDPYLDLEDVESESSLAFAKSANAACLEALGDPTTSGTGTYDRVLSILESEDRIPFVRKYGVDDDGEEILFNIWKDAKNPKGIWRRTTLSSYRTDNPVWHTVLDIDALAEQDGISWVWKGSTVLPRARDPRSNGTRITRTLIKLSRGGADAVYVKEFDLLTEKFVSEEEGGFNLPEGKTRVSFKSRDVVWVGTDFGDGNSLTDSGYARVMKEWVRGTPLEDAKVVFEGERTDVSVYNYINDQRRNNGPIYEVQGRSVTFYKSRYEARKVEFENLLAPDDPLRAGVPDPGPFVELDVQDDVEIDFVAKWIMIALRSDWEPVPGGTVYKTGSLIYTDADTFLEQGKEKCVYQTLFVPTERSSKNGYSVTKNYLILNILDNVKDRLEFYSVNASDESLVFVGGDKDAQIRMCSAGPVDPYTSDDFWFTTSGYTQPSTLCLADAGKVTSDNDVQDSYVTEELKSLPAQFDSSDVVVSQKVAVSEDGTEIPYFLVSKKDTVLDGNTPTLLYGYGGFEISLGPKYIASVGAAWLERGGAYVEACIRGGGEFGPAWHQAALKGDRNKSYEDFIAVAEHVVSTGVCKPATLAARGGSNGGLLMGNMYTMRPDLFGAIHCAVPLLDMKRYHTLLAGASWMAEYGDPDTDDWENFLYKYSSYHQIDTNVKKYPAMLVTTSTRDDRVHPAHARKMVKKLWDIGKELDRDWPVYYYENIEGGHGGAADSKQSAFMTALAYDFMWDTCCKGKTE